MAKRRSRHQVSVAATDIVPIVSDAAIAGPIAEGTMVPVLILDTTMRPDIQELMRVQGHLPPGDVSVQWASIKDRPSEVYLLCKFERPMSVRAALRFKLPDQGVLVDGTLMARAVYLQGGKPGDRFSHDPDRPKLLVEVPDTGFRSEWDKMYLARVTEEIRDRTGVNKQAARRLAEDHIARMRHLLKFRMPRR